MFEIIAKKYMELNETKAIVGVPSSGPYSLHNYFTDTHLL